MKKRVMILAPHVDDEMIGCWSVISNPENEVVVHYFYELTEERKAEAKRMLDYFDPNGDRVCAVNWAADPQDVERTTGYFEEVYVPSRRDAHADHKSVNALFRRHATHFYSVDMHDGKYLGEEESGKKHDALNWCYPSQHSLWHKNAKYYLFEAISKTDYQEIVTFRFGDFELTIPRDSYDVVRKVISHPDIVAINSIKQLTPMMLMNDILSVVPNGKVKVVQGGTTLETYNG